jgi:Holliday junction DNA helicase RuvA
MIGWLKGDLIDKSTPGKMVIDVGGVGYDVETSFNTFFELEHQSNPISLHIHTIVREDALLLYGFHEISERQLFRALIKVNGVGPKMAIAILSSLKPAEFIQHIQENNLTALTKISGVGKKTAERLVIELKDNLGDSPVDYSASKQPINHQKDAIAALVALGYSENLATQVLKSLDDNQSSSDVLIRKALQKITTRA